MTEKRTPPRVGYYPEAGLRIRRSANGLGYQFQSEAMSTGITAEQAREAAHLLNQLAEYLEST